MKRRIISVLSILLVSLIVSTNTLLGQVPVKNIKTSDNSYSPVTFLHMPYINWSPGTDYADSVRMNQGIPGIAVAPGGRLWATWYGGGEGEGPESYIMLVTSGDDGKTWSDIQIVIDPPYRASEPNLWIDPTGKLWFMWNQYPVRLKGEGSQLWVMTTETPDNERPIWSEPRLIALELNNLNKPTVLSDSTWLWPTGTWFFGRKNNENILSRPIITADKGKTYHTAGEIPILREDRNYEEYQVIERKDGTLWLLTRTKYGIGESFSVNKGKTWSEVKPSKIVHTVSRFFISRLLSGKLLLVKNGPIDLDVGRSQMMAFLSDDDGMSWYGGLMLDERDGVSYPDGTQVSGGMIYIIYDYSRDDKKEILMANFSEDDVAMGKTVSGNARFNVLVNKATGLNPLYQTPGNNEDGTPLMEGNAAELYLETEVNRIKEGSIIYMNLDYKWDQVPDVLKGKRFIRMSSEGGQIKVKSAGIMLIATPLPARDSSGLEKMLILQGFVKSNIPEFRLIRKPVYICSVFQKKVKARETINIGKMGVVIF